MNFGAPFNPDLFTIEIKGFRGLSAKIVRICIAAHRHYRECSVVLLDRHCAGKEILSGNVELIQRESICSLGQEQELRPFILQCA